MKYTVTIGDTTWTVDIQGSAVRVNDEPVDVVVHAAGGPVRRIVVGGRSLEVVATRGEDHGSWLLATDGTRVTAQVLDERSRTLRALVHKAAPDGPVVVRAPMPGLVVRVLVQPGAAVGAGQALVVVEAMKMENELKAAAAGVVEKVHVAPGDRVEKGAPLVELAHHGATQRS